jgi:hypothetical protein
MHAERPRANAARSFERCTYSVPFLQGCVLDRTRCSELALGHGGRMVKCYEIHFPDGSYRRVMGL